MKLQSHFKNFIQNLKLNEQRGKNIEEALRIWKDLIKEDDELGTYLIDFYAQGSYSTDTAVRPHGDEDFDVDVIVLFEIAEADSKQFFEWVASRIKIKEKYRDKIKVLDRCIRINYANGFHVDLVPAKTIDNDSAIKIPSKKENDWVITNPKGFREWCYEKNNQSYKQFSSIVRMLKYWRSKKVGKDTAPKSILLTTLIGHSIVTKDTYSETLIATSEKLIGILEVHLKNCTNNIIFIPNPSLTSENLARAWTPEKCRIFKDKLQVMLQQAKDALNENNEDKSVEKWQKIFGSSRFQSEISEAARMAAASSLGNLSVSSTGLINQKDEGIAIKPHRFFGGDI